MKNQRVQFYVILKIVYVYIWHVLVKLFWAFQNFFRFSGREDVICWGSQFCKTAELLDPQHRILKHTDFISSIRFQHILHDLVLLFTVFRNCWKLCTVTWWLMRNQGWLIGYLSLFLNFEKIRMARFGLILKILVHSAWFRSAFLIFPNFLKLQYMYEDHYSLWDKLM